MELPSEAGTGAGTIVLARLDDDGRPRRSGTFWTASASITTAAIGSGVLPLAWAIAQLGWVAGPAAMLLAALVVYYTSTLLAECYRSVGYPGMRNYTYMDSVRSILGGAKATFCGVIQYANIVGMAIGYTLTASISLHAIGRAGCFHSNGHHDHQCRRSRNPYVILFGAFQVIFLPIPDADELTWLSIVSAVTSFTYYCIVLCLSIGHIISNRGFQGSLSGISGDAGVSSMQKVWRSLDAISDIAFAYSLSDILIEVQDTIKAPPPSEARVMKRATRLSVAATTLFYVLCGCMGYAAFGGATPDNLLAGFGFHEPFWLLDIGNVANVIHLVCLYQLLWRRPVFAFVERWAAAATWPEESGSISGEHRVGPFLLSAFRLVSRTAFVCLTTVAAMALPSLSAVVVKLIGAFSFCTLTVYFPVEMYIAQRGVARGSAKWICLKALTVASVLVTAAAAAGFIATDPTVKASHQFHG